MAEKKLEENFSSHSAESIVGPSVRIDGDLKSNGNLRIDGSVLGKVKTSQNLFIGETANISADVEAENAVVSGTVQGNVKVSGGLSITSTGKLMGDINCGVLKVEEGAYFAGKCQMKDKPEFHPIEETNSTPTPTTKK